MTEDRVNILENQLDDMAGRLACAEAELRGLKRVLGRPRVLEILQLAKSDMELLIGSSLAATERARVGLARMEALETARKDGLLNRLAMAERLADLTGKSLSEAWAGMGKDRGSAE